MSKISISIIGLGRLGTALQRVLSELNYTEISEYGREADLVELGDVIFITTPDAVIEAVASKIAQSEEDISDKTVVHCSGTLGLDVLQIVERKSAQIGCFHPLQSITKSTKSFKGSTFDVMGTEKVIGLLKSIAVEMGANTLEVSAHQKEMLHVAAVMAANYQVTLAHAASKIVDSAGLNPEDVQHALVPLMQSVIENLEHLTPAEALTGPIARGDIQTIERHLHLIKPQPIVFELYKKLGAFTVDMLSDEQLSRTQKSQLKEKLQ